MAASKFSVVRMHVGHSPQFDGELAVWIHEVPCAPTTETAMEHEIERIRSLCTADGVMRVGSR